ncbi:MAG: hypothetical protein R3B95_21530 [Nitrospirales bacterium]|nr:hypothetical protein [Nitrospirales bacterium]
MTVLVFLCALLTLIVHGCAHLPSFPSPGVPIIKIAQDYDAVRNHPVQFQNQPAQLAGRIVHAETTTRGVTFMAEWLPFPENTYSGPETRSTPEPQPHRLFHMHFSGTVDDDGKRQGNEFLLFGHMAGLEDMVTLQGRTKTIPSFNVQCIHIWKTAGTDLYEFIWMAPLTMGYPPPLEETYCVAQTRSKN